MIDLFLRFLSKNKWIIKLLIIQDFVSIYALPLQAPQLGSGTFENVSFSTCTLYMPVTNTGYDSGVWGQFTNRVANL